MFTFKRHYILALSILLVVILAGAAGFGVYKYEQQYNSLSTRFVSLENQVATLSKALQESNSISAATKQQIQELKNRQDIVNNSGDQLLTTTVAKATQSVVSVVISKDVPLLQVQYVNPFGNDPNFQDFGIQVPTYKQVGTQRKQVGAGTGFIIRSDGYILTNRHVVDDTSADYTVLLSNGTQKTAKVIYRDTNNDLAIIKIDGSGYSPMTFGDSSNLKLGQTVVAVGNALGEFNNTVSTGIISGLNRTIQAVDSTGSVEKLSGIIQTDAAINRGNSGGPLLDLSGNVIGINVAIDQSANNIAFAIPINAVKSIIAGILK